MIRALAGAVAIVTIALCRPASAQTPAPGPAERDGSARWALLDAIGYGGLGFALGLAAAWDLEGDDFGPPGAALLVIGASTVAGTVAGAVLGRRASRGYAEGRGVGPGHGAAVVTGTILAGGALGALASIPLINSEGEGTFLGSDEQTLTLLILAGVAAGGTYAWSHRRELATSGLEVAPTVSADGRPGLHLNIRF